MNKTSLMTFLQKKKKENQKKIFDDFLASGGDEPPTLGGHCSGPGLKFKNLVDDATYIEVSFQAIPYMTKLDCPCRL